MNPKLQSSFDYLMAEHLPCTIDPYRFEPRRKEGLLVNLENSTRLIFMFSDDCLDDNDEPALCRAVENTMNRMATRNPDKEVFLNRQLNAVVKPFEQ